MTEKRFSSILVFKIHISMNVLLGPNINVQDTYTHIIYMRISLAEKKYYHSFFFYWILNEMRSKYWKFSLFFLFFQGMIDVSLDMVPGIGSLTNRLNPNTCQSFNHTIIMWSRHKIQFEYSQSTNKILKLLCIMFAGENKTLCISIIPK